MAIWRKRYTPDEDGYIVQHYGKLTIASIAKHLQRPPNSVQCRAKTLGVTMPRGSNLKNGRAHSIGKPEDGQEMDIEQFLDDFDRRHSFSDPPAVRLARANSWLGGEN